MGGFEPLIYQNSSFATWLVQGGLPPAFFLIGVLTNLQTYFRTSQRVKLYNMPIPDPIPGTKELQKVKYNFLYAPVSIKILQFFTNRI